MNNNGTVLGIEENLEAVLCYLGAWITGIIFLVVEKENKFVRFHAMQSLVTFVALFVVGMIASIIPLIGGIISILISPLGIILWLFMMYKAYQGEMYKLPYVGDFSEEQIFGKETMGASEPPESSERSESKNDDDLNID
ncbi:MAG: DUF4870 domain-containing protein [Halanaerobiales bacterium]